MLEFILFGISFILVFLSSVMIASLFKPSNIYNYFLYSILILISQIICSVELLSIFKLINIPAVLAVNLAVFILSFVFFRIKNKYKPDYNIIKTDIKQVIAAIKTDRIISILMIGLIFASCINIILALLSPSNSPDSLGYHLPRISFWIQNNTINHFETCSLRQLVFPINSEILILWSMMFLKRDYLAAIPELFAYFAVIKLLYVYLRYLKFSVKRILWAILIFASLPAVIIEASSTQTNLFMGFLLLSSLYLYVFAVKEKDDIALIFSTIAYALSLGTKSTAFIFIPVFIIVYTLIALRENGKEFYKPLLKFVLFLIPSFLFLSSYNYVLNIINFQNPFGPAYFISKHNVSLGINSFIGSLIRYILSFINFTGIHGAQLLTPVLINLKNALFGVLGLQSEDGLVYGDINTVNVQAGENTAMFGIIGLFLLFPLALYAVFKKMSLKNSKIFYITLSGIIFLGFLISISAIMGFSLWYNRFFISAVALSAPLLMLCYTRKLTIIKILIVFIVLFNFFFIPLNIDSRPFKLVIKDFFSKDFIQLRQNLRLKDTSNYYNNSPYFEPVKYLGKIAPDHSSIGLILSCEDGYYQFFEENTGWKIHSIKYADILKTGKIPEYDYLVVLGNGQFSDIFENRISYLYKIKDNDILAPNSQTTIYIDKNGRAVTSGSPILAYTPINFTEIEQKYNLIKSFTAQNHKFYIYKRK